VSKPFIRVAETREVAHDILMQAYGVARMLLLDGKRVRVEVAADNDPKSVKQRRFLHGVVLTQIAEQVRVDGRRYVVEIWKEHVRALFLGSTWESFRMPGDVEALPHESRVSTEGLSLTDYSRHIDKVIAYAITDLGVEFDFDAWERESVRHEPKQKEATC
jgi:hypothetical protein